MAREITPSIAQFSFDQLVSEVDAIVEDLRWVHLELSLRNRCTEILFREGVGMEQVLQHAFADLREKLGVCALSVFLKDRTAYRSAFQDADPEAAWLRDRLPWMESVDRWYGHSPRDASAQQPVVNHYTVDAQPITAITMPILLGREFAAVLLLVTPSSTMIPRLKRLVSGLSSTLSLAIATVAARRGALVREHADLLPGDVRATGGGNVPADVPQALFPVHSIRSFFALQLAADGTLLDVNDRFADETGVTPAGVKGTSFIETLVPPDERDALRRAFADILASADSGGTPLTFGIRTKDGGSSPVLWYVTQLRGDDDRLHGLGCFGVPLPQPSDAAPASPVAQDLAVAAEARLSKQYRFMIKYVPFPIFHLDRGSDTVKNANPAFEALIGGARWENMPLSDFGTLVIHGNAGDTQPCTLRLISPGGITITYRGIITPLLIFGKLIREVKLDPIE